ncbi:hypothetical protein OKW23_001414 [Bacilli bacterium PM5-9]|nr:hypothetical protein [Bacilli bacterium PM5-9]
MKKNIGLNKSRIGTIEYGEIHSYYPLYICDEMSNTEVLKKIENSEIVVNEKFYVDEKRILHNQFSNLINNLESSNVPKLTDIEKYVDDEDGMEKYIEEKLALSDSEKQAINEGKAFFEITSDDSTYTKIEVKSTKIETMKNYEELNNRNYELMCKQAGINWVTKQEQFFLLPLSLKLENGQKMYIPVTLIIFDNSMGVIKLSYPIINSSDYGLKEHNYEQYIHEMKYEKDDVVFDGLDEVVNYIIAKISFILDCSVILKTNNNINFIYLLEYDGLPKAITNLSNELKKDIYLIINSPVPAYHRSILEKKEVDLFVNSQCYSISGVNTYLRRSGGGVTIFDKSFIDFFINQNNIDAEKDKEEINMCIASDIATSNEYAILIILLKRLNVEVTLYNQTSSNNSSEDIYRAYLNNNLYINQLQELCLMKSMNEQVDFFEEKMQFYTNKPYILERVSLLNKILEIKETKERERNNFLLSIIGTIFTFVFGLPGISETLKLIRKTFSSIPDIPYINIEKVSMIIWIISVVFFIKMSFNLFQGLTEKK